MSQLARVLLLLAVVAALVGVVALAVPLPTWTTASITDAVVRHAQECFDSVAWRWLGALAVVAMGAALVLGVGELLLGVRRPVRGPEFAQLDEHSIREAVTEVRRRVQQCVGKTVHVVELFNELVRGAVSVSASDIHISPTPEALKLTYRVHGTLYQVASVPLDVAAPLTTRVKVLARLDTYVRGSPQDGRLVQNLDGGVIEARVSTLPTEMGERIVLRLVRGGRQVPDLESLMLGPDVSERLENVLSRPQGLLFVTGPVGSGKTTTLCASMKHIARTRGTTTTLVTLEDPIELELPFATQTQMHPKAGMTFASTLRSVLRQDPNVLMLGEIRDRETADIAMQAGLTGHLILTTVHGQSAAGVFARLVDMNVESFILASATVGCLSQRLVRTLCTACRREAAPGALVVDRFTQHGIVLPPGPYYEPVGCDFCEGQGYSGRLPIAELLVMNEPLRKVVNARETSAEIHAVAVAEGMTPLLRDGLNRAVAGETSLAEVLRVAG